ncbi:MAG: FAD-binding oxidoreductase [Bacillus subtilis]|nr:FAD-binding oxidoreductase [Bacillus subtilis]
MVYSHDVYCESKPEVVILPTNREEVAEVLKLANRERVPVTPPRLASGLSGMCVPAEGGIVMAMSKMNKILEINKEDRLAVVEPGVITNDLQVAVEAQGAFYPPDPASQTICQIGGNVATNAGDARGASNTGSPATTSWGSKRSRPPGSSSRRGGGRSRT